MQAWHRRQAVVESADKGGAERSARIEVDVNMSRPNALDDKYGSLCASSTCVSELVKREISCKRSCITIRMAHDLPCYICRMFA